MKAIYLVRHCKAEGQDASAPLTPQGFVQANILADVLGAVNVERIISSPYLRATQSIAPLAQRLRLEVEVDSRLIERDLCSPSREDWQDCLRASFSDLTKSFDDRESSSAAIRRAVAVVADIERHSARNTVVVTHGNLMALLLKHFDASVGFAEWAALTNPDVHRVGLTEPFSIRRLWSSLRQAGGPCG
jgi:2,3-bisphosphoglycerate-dependent phosphoglycerate mutase